MSRQVAAFIGIFAGIVAIVAAALWFFFGRGPSTDDVAEFVQKGMQNHLATDPKYSKYALEVRDVSLVPTTGNEYKGVAEVYWHRDRAVHNVAITVVYDGSQGIWQTERGSFLFLFGSPADQPVP
ncbi:hypothetical protein SEA_XAVIA_33 [Mycobacterium phage Xavia]|uniref:Uncharacterized protein n=1 Tax=Mycobacterium phage Xavia TaxID=2178923 RepID=A0A2U8UHZ7_9CAUD|nr:hypothetical protein I5J51_gp33 [Mycobacterium phage Xavia]AWN02635.1 hypothetical protein SEA_XAVIA_33 [Mycobacterium phage Xavia]